MGVIILGHLPGDFMKTISTPLIDSRTKVGRKDEILAREEKLARVIVAILDTLKVLVMSSISRCT